MRKFLILLFLAVFLVGTATMAMATKIEYTATDNGGGNYTLGFEVFNETLTSDIEWFSIFFGQTTDGLNFTNWDQFSNFSPDDWGFGPEPQPTGWDSYSLEFSTINLPGQFNSDIFTASGIANGSSLGGFTVSFDWTGTGSYDHLFYEVGNFDTSGGYATLDTGYTELGGGVPIPEPGTIMLMSIGLAGLGFLRRKKGFTK